VDGDEWNGWTTGCAGKKVESAFEPHDPKGGTDLRFSSPQLDTSFHYKTKDTGLVHRVVCVCVYSPAVGWYQIILPGHRATQVKITRLRYPAETETRDLLIMKPMSCRVGHLAIPCGKDVNNLIMLII